MQLGSQNQGEWEKLELFAEVMVALSGRSDFWSNGLPSSNDTTKMLFEPMAEEDLTLVTLDKLARNGSSVRIASMISDQTFKALEQTPDEKETRTR